MPSRSPSRGRSPARSHTATSVRRAPSRGYSRSPSPRRSASPRSLPQRDGRNGNARGRSRSRSASRSRSPSRGDRRSYRDRSYTRSLSRESRRVQSSKIVVEKLTRNVTEAHLREIFGSYGRIESIDLPLNKQFMTNRGTAYILYDHPSGSEAAIAHMHEAQLDGMVISPDLPDQVHHHLDTGRLREDHRLLDIEVHQLEEEGLEVEEEAQMKIPTSHEPHIQDHLHPRDTDGDAALHIRGHLQGVRLGDEDRQPEARHRGGEEVQVTVLGAVIVGAEAGREAAHGAGRGMEVGDDPDSHFPGRQTVPKPRREPRIPAEATALPRIKV